jgi:hypothetical protein
VAARRSRQIIAQEMSVMNMPPTIVSFLALIKT